MTTEIDVSTVAARRCETATGFVPLPDRPPDDIEPARDENGEYRVGRRARSVSKKRWPACHRIPKFFDPSGAECNKCLNRGPCEKLYEQVLRKRDRAGSGALYVRRGCIIPVNDLPGKDQFGVMATIRRWYWDNHRFKSKQTRWLEAQQAREAQKIGSFDPVSAIATMSQRRLRALHLGQKRHGRKPVLEQIQGREQELSDFWFAMQVAALQFDKPTNTQIATVYNELTGQLLTRHQACNRRRLIKRLEQPGEVWENAARDEAADASGGAWRPMPA